MPLFAVGTSCYILLAIQFEERDLVREHGVAYEEYRRNAPMLVPFTSLTVRKKLERIGVATSVFFLIKGIIWLAVAGAVLWR